MKLLKQFIEVFKELKRLVNNGDIFWLILLGKNYKQKQIYKDYKKIE